MSRKSLIVSIVILLLLLIGGGAGVWWYLRGAPLVASAELVPGDTVLFAEIPNATNLALGYETSHLKTLVNDPNIKPQIDKLIEEIGPKNMELIQAFLPNLSGQAFFALTHVDADKPAEIGLIAALKPKPGFNHFNEFVDKLKATYPDVTKEGKTGTANVEGVDYQWIQGPGAPDKICVAQVDGWIVTTWGEATLKDWIDRLHNKAATPSLAQNDEYKKSLDRVGKSSMTSLYINYHIFVGLIQKAMAANPILTAQNPGMADYLGKKLSGMGGLMLASTFENGDIMDRVSLLMPHQMQVDAGMSSTPCSFESLKFTGQDTHLYWATSVDFKQYWKNIVEQMKAFTPANGAAAPPDLEATVEGGAKAVGLDFQRNIIGALGSELSLQLDWDTDAPYPEVGLLVKVAKPDDFQPTIDAIIKEVHAATTAYGVIRDLKTDGQDFVSLKFATGSPITPTMTKGGSWFGLFLSENQAAESFHRTPANDLSHNADFVRQIGDKRNGASTILFLDTPYVADRTYRTVTPYLSMAAMFSKELGALLQGKDLPNDLKWLAPIGTWSAVSTPDNDGVTGYSVSGVGNQGIFIALGAVGISSYLQASGMLPGMAGGATPSAPPTLGSPLPSSPATGTNPSPVTPTGNMDATPSTNAAPDATAPVPGTPAPESTPAPAASTPASDTNAPSSTPDTSKSPQ